jgi:hypothetical protein
VVTTNEAMYIQNCHWTVEGSKVPAMI